MRCNQYFADQPYSHIQGPEAVLHVHERKDISLQLLLDISTVEVNLVHCIEK